MLKIHCAMKPNKYNSILLFVIVMMPIGLNAQSLMQFSASQSDTNFFQIASKFYQTYPGYGEDRSESSSFTQFQRWADFWAPRLGSTGSFKIAAEAKQNYVNTSNAADRLSSVTSSNWQALGPEGDATGNGVGRIISLAFDPNYDGITDQIMYAGGANSGVWRYGFNGSSQWENLNTDQQFAGLGVSSIAVDPVPNSNNINNIYAATGDFDDGFPTNGIYRSTDNGVTWSAINQGLPLPSTTQYTIGKLLVDPLNSAIMYAATSVGLFECGTQQLGQGRQSTTPNWVQIYPSPGSTELVANVLLDPTDKTNNTLFAAGVDIIQSTNRGTSWASIATGAVLNLSGTPNLTSNNNAFIINSNNPTDPNYPNNTPNPSTQFVWRINIAISADGNFLYAAINTCTVPYVDWNSTHFNYFFQFTNSPTLPQWTQENDFYRQTYQQGQSPSPNRFPYQVSPVNNLRIYTGDVYSASSTDGGKTWGELNCNGHNDHHAIEFVPNDPNTLFLGTDGGVWKVTLDATTGAAVSGTCTEMNNGLGVATITYSSSSVFDPHQILAGMQDCGVNYYKNSSWTNYNGFPGGDAFESAMDYSNVNVMYITTYNPAGSLFSSSSSATQLNFGGAINFGLYLSPEPPSYYAYNGAPLVLDPVDPSIIYQGRTEVFKSTSGANTNYNSWTAISDFYDMYQIFGGYPINDVSATFRISIAPSNTNIIYVVFAFDSNNKNSFSGKLAKTTVGGGLNPGDWTDISPPANINIAGDRIGYPITGLAVSSVDPNHIWISYSGYDATLVQKVQESTDGGITWTVMPWTDNTTSANLPNVPVTCVVYEKGSNDGIYVGTDIGVYYHNNTMNGWEPFMTGLPNVEISWLVINYTSNTIQAATYGRGMWESNLQCPPATTTPSPLTNTVSLYEFDEATLVQSEEQILAGATVTYRGTSEVDLLPGFQANNGSSFRAFIHPCNASGNSDPLARQKGSGNSSKGGSSNSEIINPTILKQPNIPPGAMIYPNPNNGAVTVVLNLPSQNSQTLAEFKLYDMTGELVLDQLLTNPSSSLDLTGNGVKNGMYYYSIISNGQRVKQDKLVVLR